MPAKTALEKVERDSRERLYPSLRNPNWLILRRRRQIFEAGLESLPLNSLCVLDIGGKLQPFRPLLNARTKNYIAIDLRKSPLVQVEGKAEELPFRDGQFDVVICTQVLEYLPNPQKAIDEVNRVLREAGVLFLSVPSVFLRDNEKECWRFLPEGIRHLLRDFQSVEVVPEGNSLVGFFRTCNVVLASFFRPRILGPIWRLTFVPFLNIAGSLLSRLGKENVDFTANYSIWARK